MLRPLFQRRSRTPDIRHRERGVTMALVAASMVSIIGMAALAIDVGTIYQANAEAQRSADAAALTAAKVLSMSGMTGDPNNTSGQWQNACNAAQAVALAVGKQNLVGGAIPTVTVTPSASDGTSCASTGGAFGVNPMVTVKVSNTTLPTFFAHVFGFFNSNWSTARVSATATAELYNPSNSATYSTNGAVMPVQPRCVKPLIIPNTDPLNTPGCTPTTCTTFVNPATGAVTNGGILLGGSGTGVIGETFNLYSDCTGMGTTCNFPDNPPKANLTTRPAILPPKLEYVPGYLSSVVPVAVPSCATGDAYQEAVAGCDQSTQYHCGVQAASLAANANEVDLSENPNGVNGDTSTAVQCLIHQSSMGASSGQDSLSTATFPYQITAGSANPTGANGYLTNSSSIITIPIYDLTGPALNTTGTSPVTIVGFLQVFVNQVDSPGGSLNVTVLNVTGCGNGVNALSPFVTGSSPVPVRLITPSS